MPSTIGFHAEVTHESGPLTDEQLADLALDLKQATGHTTPIGYNSETGRVTAQILVDAPTIKQATDAALRLGRDTLPGVAVHLRVLTQDDYAAELERPARVALVGSKEGGELLGVSRQRFEELARTHTDFPRPIADLARGKIWTRDSIAAFNDRWERKTGRPANPSAMDGHTHGALVHGVAGAVIAGGVGAKFLPGLPPVHERRH